MQSSPDRSNFNRSHRPGIESLETRLLFTSVLVNEGAGEIGYFDGTAGVNNYVIFSTGPADGYAKIQDNGDVISLTPGVASLGWTLSSDAHTAYGPESQVVDFYVDTGDGNDIVAVQSNDRPIKIRSEVATTEVTVGTGVAPVGAQLNTAAIDFDCSLVGGGILLVNDTGDPIPRNVVATATSITGLTPAPITFDGTLTEANLVSGTGGDTFTVNQTTFPSGAGTEFLWDAKGNDTVNVKQLGVGSQVVAEELDAASVVSVNIGNDGSSAGIYGTIDVGGVSGRQNLTIDCSADNFDSHPSIADGGGGQGSITGINAETINFNLFNTQTLTFLGGTGGDAITYDLPGGVPANFSAMLFAGAGDDTVDIVANPANATLQVDGGGGSDRFTVGEFDVVTSGLQGAITLTDTLSAAAIRVDARNAASTQPTVTINDSTVNGLIPATLSFFDPASLTVIGSAGIQTFNLTPSPTTSFTIDGGPFAPRAAAADVLNVNTAGVNAPVLHLQTDATGEQGSYTFANRKPVAFSRMGGVTPALGTISGMVSSGQTGLVVAGAPLFLDENGNGSFDGGEPSVLSDAFGHYQFTALAPGSYPVLLGAGPFVAFANPLPTTVAAGQDAAGINFVVVPAPTSGGPDLSGQLIAPAALGGGSNGKLKLKITNAGPGAASASVQISLFASADAVLDPTDTSLGNLPATQLKLGRGASKTLSFTTNVPSTIADGNYFVLASIDSTNTVAESNEANNVAASGSPVRIAKSFIDLNGAFAGRSPTSIPPGKSVATAVLVGNAGNITATGSISISLFASADSTLDSGDTLITKITGQKIAIKPNRSHSIVAHLRAPSGLAKGNYFLIAVVNSDHTLADANAANDLAVSASAVSFN